MCKTTTKATGVQLLMKMAAVLALFTSSITFAQNKAAGSAGHTSKKPVYERDRDRLVAGDRLRAFDADVVLHRTDKIANEKLLEFQASMLRQYDSVHFFPPANHFFKSKEHSSANTLFGLLKKMPKGGIHHLH